MSTQHKQPQSRRPQPARTSRRRTRTPLVLLLAALLIATPMAAWGTWSSQDTLQANASAGSVAPPTTLQCREEGGLLDLLARYVVLTWNEPVSGPPDGYVLVAHAEEEAYVLAEVDGSTRSFEVRTGLLTGVLEGLLTLLLGGVRPPITVHAVDSGWESVSSNSVEIRTTVLGLGGLGCA